MTPVVATARPVLLCLSHLRWDWVFQRPQHLMTRAAQVYDVVFFEEPAYAGSGDDAPALRTRTTPEGVLVATPVLPGPCDPVRGDAVQRGLLDGLLDRLGRPVDVAWFYTPMALEFAGHLDPALTVFDSMDELSAFSGASPRLALLERRLLKRADLVFTGGRSLYEAKCRLHPRVHLFPSSVNAAHFGAARAHSDPAGGPPDQAAMARPRIGFFGVIDERMDLELVAGIAERRPDWHLVMVGPVAKIDPATLPRRSNVHWLGMKSYAELPAYLAGWDAGVMPFALNAATRFISPTKTLEFLAAGVPLASTPVPDVVSDWGAGGLVEIADGTDAMVAALDRLLARPRRPWLADVDRRLARTSWNATWARMGRMVEDARAPVSAGAAGPPASAGEPARV